MSTREPEVKYAKSGEVHVAYQVWGDGPVNIVSTPGIFSHLDSMWEEPGLRRYFEGLAQFARVATFDKRGTGLSDRGVGIPTFEERMDDIRAVMDAAHFGDAVLIGISEGVPMSVLFAASYPSRTRGLVLYGGEARGLWAPDYPWASTQDAWEASFQRTEQTWGTKEWVDRFVSALAPNRVGDDKFTGWLSRMARIGTTPGAFLALSKSEMMMDVTRVLPTVHVPTLVIHLTGDKVSSVEEGRYLARHIPGAKFVELAGVDHMFWADNQLSDRILGEVRSFITEIQPVSETTRVLTTVLLTDIVSSTEKAADMGDARWQRLLEDYNSMAKNEINRFKGNFVKNTGDGFLAIFDGPTRAIRCACAVRDDARGLGLEVRAGLHTGECILGSDDISGIAVHIAARVLGQAGPGEVLVSSTVKDLVVGSKIPFRDCGVHELKGVDEEWRIFSVQATPVADLS
jgi:class 3 adenylate cyclase/pimeloyl-ACP methyl ester carboxylesterase